MRDVLLKRVRPLVERLAADLTELAVQRIEAELERIAEAFAVALSSYASDGAPAARYVSGLYDGAPDLEAAALGASFGGPPIDSTMTASAVEDNPRPTSQRKRSKRAATPGQSASSAAGNVAEPHRAPKEHRSAGAVVVTRPCGCAPRGRHRRDCKQGSPSVDRPAASDADDEPAPAPRRTRNLQATYDMITRAQAGDQSAMNELVRQNVGLVHWAARRYAWSSVPYEDMVQEGLMGLVEALKRFDVSRGLRLTTYASHWIRHSITRAHENDGLIRLPVASHQQLRLVARARKSAGPDASIDAIAERAGIHVRSVQRLIERGTVTQPATLPDAAAPADDGDDEERVAMAREHITTLPDRLRRVMELRYSGDGMTLHEVGNVLGVSRERVRQLETAAVRAIRAKLSADEGTAG